MSCDVDEVTERLENELCSLIYSMGSKLDSFLRKRCLLFCFIHVVLLISLEIMRKKNYISRFIYKDVILFSKIYYVFDVAYVKSNSISC